jgi:hypothetical protein
VTRISRPSTGPVYITIAPTAFTSVKIVPSEQFTTFSLLGHEFHKGTIFQYSWPGEFPILIFLVEFRILVEGIILRPFQHVLIEYDDT